MKYSGFNYEIDFDLDQNSSEINTIVVYERIDKLISKFFNDIMKTGPIENFKLSKNIKEIREQ